MYVVCMCLVCIVWFVCVYGVYVHDMYVCGVCVLCLCVGCVWGGVHVCVWYVCICVHVYFSEFHTRLFRILYQRMGNLAVVYRTEENVSPSLSTINYV